MKYNPWNAWNFYFVSSYQETAVAEQAGVICPWFYIRFTPKQDPSLDLSLVHSFISVGLSRVSSNLQRAAAMGEDRSALLLEVLLLFHSDLFPFLAGQQDRRTDLSHPIHADNCLLDPEANECWKEPPAYTFRDYR